MLIISKNSHVAVYHHSLLKHCAQKRVTETHIILPSSRYIRRKLLGPNITRFIYGQMLLHLPGKSTYCLWLMASCTKLREQGYVPSLNTCCFNEFTRVCMLKVIIITATEVIHFDRHSPHRESNLYPP